MSRALEWDIRVPLVPNVSVLVDLLLLVVFLSVALAGGFLFLTGFQNVYEVLRWFIIADSVFIVLLFMVMGFVFTNQFHLQYRLSDEGVLLKVGEFDISLNRAAWVISRFVQRLFFSSGRVYRLMNEELFVSWDQVSRAVFDERRRVANLTSDLHPLMRVYCTPENVDLVFQEIQGHVPEPED